MEQVFEQILVAPLGAREPAEVSGADEASASGVSCAAVFGGAVVTASMCLVLLTLGAGLGFSAVSPWAGVGLSGRTIGNATIGWFVATQFMAGTFGGYVAGRLRVKWAGIHDDEVYFRDTAHGLLAWGLAFVFTAGFLATAGTLLMGAEVASTPTAGTAATTERTLDPNVYYVDLLLRPGVPAVDSTAAARAETSITRAEIGRIFAKSLADGQVNPEDRTYAVQVIGKTAGIGTTAADTRLTNVFTSAQQAADAARHATAKALLWVFIALLIGAFTASFGATMGGHQRDNVKLVG